MARQRLIAHISACVVHCATFRELQELHNVLLPHDTADEKALCTELLFEALKVAMGAQFPVTVEVRPFFLPAANHR